MSRRDSETLTRIRSHLLGIVDDPNADDVQPNHPDYYQAGFLTDLLEIAGLREAPRWDEQPPS